MMALAGGPAASAAAKRLPIKAGPHGMSRAPSVVTPKIVGGTSVPNGKYRFQAALLAQSFGNDDFQRQVPLSDLRVVVGRTVLTSTQGQKRRVAAIDIHPPGTR